MDINLNESNNKKDQFNSNALCDICQNVEGEYECQECPTFKILCPKCDLFIHSMQNKSKHIRQKIKQNNIPNNELIINDNEDIDKTKTNNNTNKETSPITNNYLEQIKGIYEQDKQMILDENISLQQMINSNQNLYKHKINNLQNKLNELKVKNDNNLRLMKDNHNMDLKQLITEKDFEINYLINNNKELEKINNELKTQLNENMGQYTKNQSNYNDILTTLESTLNKLQKENIDIKEYYENKINYLIDNFNMEKKKLINSYELNIEQLNNDYNISKDKYITYLGKRDNDKLEKENEQLKSKIEELNIEIDNLNKRIKELLIQIEKLNEEIEYLKYKGKKVPKDKNALFCFLYKSFSEKFILKYKLDMIIGMFMRKLEKEMEIKINKLKEINENYKKRIQILNEENESFKISLNQEVEKEEQTPEDNNINNISNTDKKEIKVNRFSHNRSSSQGGLSKFIGTSTRQYGIGNAIITTKTTQISYRKKRKEGNV